MKAGYDTYSASSDKEGLILAYQHRPHVIIIDPANQEPNYQELISKLRKDRRLARTKIFAFSSLKSPEEIQNALNLGFDEYLAKESHALQKLIEITQQAAKAARSPSPATPARCW